MAIVPCPNCGKRLSDKAPVCNFCGVTLRAADEPAPVKKSPQFLQLREAKADGRAEALPIDCDAAVTACVTMAESIGLEFDLSPASVYTLDIWLDDFVGADGFAPDQDRWQPEPKQGQILIVVGAYLGEVLRRLGDGLWCAHPEQPKNVNFVQLMFPAGGVTWPVGRVFRRFKNGSGEALFPFLTALREQLERPERSAEAPDWGNQGAVLHRLKRYEHSIACLDVAIRLDPEQPDYHVVRAQDLLALGRRDEASDELIWCAEHPSEDWEMNKAVAHMEQLLARV